MRAGIPARFQTTLPGIHRHLQAGPVKACWLTPRAADGGYAPRFLAFFVAFGFLRFGGEATLRPTAANADR